MEVDRWLLVAHCAAHALSLLAGLAVVAPLALNGSAFKGRCALFSTGSWMNDNRTGVTEPGEEGDSSHLVIEEWGPPEACQFATYVGVFTVLYGAAQTSRSGFYLTRRHDDTLFSMFVTLLASLCVLFLSGGAGVTLSLGLESWCDTVTDDGTRPYSCAESQLVPLYLDVDTTAFYTQLTCAEVSLWCVTVLWLTQSILAYLRLSHSHSEHLRGTRLPGEKERLLGGHRPLRGRAPSLPLLHTRRTHPQRHVTFDLVTSQTQSVLMTPDYKDSASSDPDHKHTASSLRGSSADHRVGGSNPASAGPHVEVSLGKDTEPLIAPNE